MTFEANTGYLFSAKVPDGTSTQDAPSVLILVHGTTMHVLNWYDFRKLAIQLLGVGAEEVHWAEVRGGDGDLLMAIPSGYYIRWMGQVDGHGEEAHRLEFSRTDDLQWERVN
jgi:hypothetical protein